MFLVMILVTSWRSSFNLSKLEDAAFAVRVSRYSRAVFDMNVSVKKCYNTWGMRSDKYCSPKPTNAYGFRTVSTFGPYVFANSLESSSRYENANLRG